MEYILSKVINLIPSLVVIAIVISTIAGLNWFLFKRKSGIGEGARFTNRIIMGLLTVVGLVIIILALPVGDATRGQLLGFLGLLLSAIIALSSTTFVANAMAGLMLRAVKSFRSGDFIRVDSQFGRVTERGLFHTEIQTENRNLVTIPNLFLVTNPVNVVRSSGTIVSADVSLGYDVPSQKIKDALKFAANEAKLEEPFVRIMDLGDYSVTYRIAGFLKEVKGLLTAQSLLRQKMLDALHAEDIEIVSPTFMNQRQIKLGTQFLPPKIRSKIVKPIEEPTPEDLIFDKADEAQKVEELQLDHDNLLKELAELEELKKEAVDDELSKIEKKILRKAKKVSSIKDLIDKSIKKADIG